MPKISEELPPIGNLVKINSTNPQFSLRARLQDDGCFHFAPPRSDGTKLIEKEYVDSWEHV